MHGAAITLAQGLKGDYELIQLADILPVTNKHDFFGISVLEAVYAVAIPLLPYRMAYTEHFTSTDVSYHVDEEFLPALRSLFESKVVKSHKLQKMVKKYDWRTMILQYDDLFSTLCS